MVPKLAETEKLTSYPIRPSFHTVTSNHSVVNEWYIFIEFFDIKITGSLHCVREIWRHKDGN
jgi:uncharacterized protein Usg